MKDTLSTSKACTKCGVVQDRETCFHKDGDGRVAWCKACGNAAARAWYAANKGRRKAWRAANKERCRAVDAARVAANKANPAELKDLPSSKRCGGKKGKRGCGLTLPAGDFGYDRSNKRLNTYCRACVTAMSTASQTPEKKARLLATRRAREIAAGPDISHAVKLEIWEECGRACTYCRRPVPPPDSDHKMEHRVPLCRGGTNARENRAAVCKRCQEEKQGRLESEWVLRWYERLAYAAARAV